MKKILLSTVAVVLIAGIVMPAVAAMKFRRPALAQKQEIVLNQVLSEVNPYLNKALIVHNILNTLPQVRSAQEQSKIIQEQHLAFVETQQYLEECNIEQLGKHFNAPKEVWDTMKNIYSAREKALQTVNPVNEVGAYEPLTSFESEAEKSAPWNIGRNIMLDVYAEPKKWGELRPNVTALPLWEDQKYVYDQGWDKNYEQLNAMFGVPAKQRPLIPDNIKYDHTRYDEVQAAHQAYVAELTAANPAAAAMLAAEAATGIHMPSRAPVPLPPPSDILVRSGGGVSPQMPESWQAMQSSGDLNPEGEYAQFLNESDEESSNRLYVYDQVSKQTAMYAQAAEASKKMENTFLVGLKRQLRQQEIDIPKIDLMEVENYALITKLLNEKKTEYIAMAREYADKLAQQEEEDPRIKIRREKRMAQRESKYKYLADEDPEAHTSIMNASDNDPVKRQKETLDLLEQDEQADAYLTESTYKDFDKIKEMGYQTKEILRKASTQLRDIQKMQNDHLDEMTCPKT